MDVTTSGRDARRSSVTVAGAAGRTAGVRPKPDRSSHGPTRRRSAAGLLLAALLVLVVLPTACTGDATTTTTGAAANGGGATPATVAQGGQPFPAPTYLQPQPVDLGAVVNYGDVRLSPEAEAILGRQGFVVTNDPDGWVPWKFWHVYEEARYAGVPVIVTTDAVLNSYHTIFDLMLQRLEETVFSERMEAMSIALQTAASNQVSDAAGTPMEEAALANEAYFAVGNSLIQGGITAPERVRDRVEVELALIEAAGGLQTSPILGYDEDYTQYKPRGHYTRSEQLKRYFRAMMWYGHAAFWTDPHEPGVTEDLARRLTRQAALITLALTGETEHSWKAVYEPTTFLVGAADDLGAAELRPAMGVAFGTQTPSLADLADDAKIDAFRAELRKLPAPMIMSVGGSIGPEQEREESSRSFRVMGQRYIPDSYAFQQLVWNHVGTEEKKRSLPFGLDAMAVLGSDQAFEILTTTYGQQEFDGYVDQLMKVKAEFDTRAPTFWPDTIYTGWLDGLRLAMAFPPEEAPDLMKTKVWARKNLNGALGSWTELRHDTILYAKQSVAAEGDGGEEPESVGYVEPYPDFYAHMAGLAIATRDGLAAYGLLDENLKSKLDTMVQLCTDLERVARKELAGEALDEEDAQAIRWFGNTLETLELFHDDEGRTMSPPDEKSPVVADVHTDLIAGAKALEEGTGYPKLLYAVLEVDGKLQVFMGASYEYYEFTVPMADRMTDEEWQAVLDAGTQPPRPVWTDEFMVTPPTSGGGD
ncbi:MAG: DUF3160 domain-containing protein [Thermoleophilia bacterium]